MAVLSKEQAIALLKILGAIEGTEGEIDGVESSQLDSEENIVGVYWKQEGAKKYRFAYKIRPEEGTGAITPITADAISSFFEWDDEEKEDAIALNERELELDWAADFAEVGIDFAETPTLPDPQSLAPEKLKQVQTAVVKQILQSGNRGYKGRIDEIVFENGNPMKGLFSDRRTRPVKVLRYEITTTSKSFSPVSGFELDEEGDR